MQYFLEKIKLIDRKILLLTAIFPFLCFCIFACGLSLFIPAFTDQSTEIAQSTTIVELIETQAPTNMVAPFNTTEPTTTPRPTDTRQATNTAAPINTTGPTTTPRPTNTRQVTNTQQPPTQTETPTNQTPMPIPDGDLATVTNIVDGDTIDVNLGGTIYRVRYIGMDTPERGDFYFNESTEANRILGEGHQVILVKDVSETDQFGRLLRYVYLQDGTFINAEMVKRGYALIATFPPDVRFQELFLILQQEARDAGRGFWASPTPTSAPPAPTAPLPTSAPAPTNVPVPTNPPPPPTSPPQPTSPPPSNCDPSYPTVCIPPPPPDLDCGEIPYKDFTVHEPDPHHFDGDNDGIGCES